MSQPVKRTYRADKRAQTAEATRAAIRAAAGELFIESGYAATTMREVARRAGVGERTLYDTFPNKLELFRHTIGVATVGDEEPVAVLDRPEVLAAFDEVDPLTAVTRVVEYTAGLFERAGDLIMVGIEAGAADAGMKAGSEAGAEHTYQFWLGLTRNLFRVDALRPELDAESAADIAFALGSPHVFRLLRRQRGWAATRYREWLTGAVTAQLLRE
ncbi:TetR/AcrR family transcriptional regulator [Nocardia sp. SYP-A9097]|uniref:TetR/AcrR family transcriptional regulator n=1 Tax=Nocardia sp. SYP-A9097 TaxID=2663237 RepID=UPI0018910543|nr:helix-turn-helix domain-containing protein [Nocardia sp. SYP-A9097]